MATRDEIAGEVKGFGRELNMFSRRANRLVKRFNLAPGLGRLDASRSAETTNALGQLQSSTQGMSGQEYQGRREAAHQSVYDTYKGAQSDLARSQARSGVRGAFANAQNKDLASSLLTQKRALENQLMLDDVNVRDQARINYTNALRGFQQDETAKQTFNLGQEAKEAGAKSTGFLGMLSMLLGQKSAKDSKELGLAEIAAAGGTDALNAAIERAYAAVDRANAELEAERRKRQEEDEKDG